MVNNNVEILYPAKSVPVLSPYKPNKMVGRKRTQFSPFGLRIRTRSISSLVEPFGPLSQKALNCRICDSAMEHIFPYSKESMP